MPTTLADRRAFFREFRRNFRTTGAVLPSGRRLALALTRYVRTGASGKRILEAGPGTGAVTHAILEALAPADSLDLVEWNESFVQRLRDRFTRDPLFLATAPRCRVIHNLVEQLPEEHAYDRIISGLPLNNFEVDEVERILIAFERLIRPGGIVSFFEYTAVRTARSLVNNPQDRARLQGISRVLSRWLNRHEIARNLVLANIPPAWVHHVQPI